MTETEARIELTRRPLVFGDAAQIRARIFLENVALAREAFESCPDGHEHPLREHPLRECAQCDGEGYIEMECDGCNDGTCGDCEEGTILDCCHNCDGEGKVIVFDELCECIAGFSDDVIAALRVIVKIKK
jgi:hypothetical protein